MSRFLQTVPRKEKNQTGAKSAPFNGLRVNLMLGGLCGQKEISNEVFMNNRNLCIVLTGLLVLLISCGEKKSTKSPEISQLISPDKSTINRFAINPFQNEDIKDQSDSLKAIFDLTGPALKQEVREVKNKYDPNLTDKEYVLDFENYSLLYYFASFTNKYNLNYLHIDSDKNKLKSGVFFGMSEKEIVKIFGPSENRNTFKTNYELGSYGEGGRQVNFLFKDEKLRSIIIWYYNG